LVIGRTFGWDLESVRKLTVMERAVAVHLLKEENRQAERIRRRNKNARF